MKPSPFSFFSSLQKNISPGSLDLEPWAYPNLPTMAQQLRGKGITLEKVLVPSDPSKRKTKVRAKVDLEKISTTLHL